MLLSDCDLLQSDHRTGPPGGVSRYEFARQNHRMHVCIICLADLPDNAYHGFLCVEAANAGDSAVTVMPGGKHVLLTQVSLPTVV